MSKVAVFALALVFVPAVALAAEPRNVAIVLYQDVELLDFAGPGEVFATSGHNAFNVFTVGPSLEPIVSQGFVKIAPDYSIDNSPKPDIIVIPGGRSSMLYENPKMMTWIKERSRTAELTMSVCTGAIALAKAGLLDGLKATTHFGAIASLRKFPRVTVVPGDRFVDNGRFITTQGVSAGIDGALHVVERLLGTEAAWADAHYMMYAWEPAGMSNEAKAELRSWVFQDWPAVEATYQHKLDGNPKDVVAAARVGIAQKELGKNERAVVTLEHALALGSRDVDVLDELGDARFALGRYAAAAQAYEQELPLRAANAQPFVAMSAAKAWSRAGNKDAALAALQKSAAAGKLDCKSVEKDPDLLALHDDPRFAALMRAGAERAGRARE